LSSAKKGLYVQLSPFESKHGSNFDREHYALLDASLIIN
jgi:hypothetical protein